MRAGNSYAIDNYSTLHTINKISADIIVHVQQRIHNILRHVRQTNNWQARHLSEILHQLFIK